MYNEGELSILLIVANKNIDFQIVPCFDLGLWAQLSFLFPHLIQRCVTQARLTVGCQGRDQTHCSLPADVDGFQGQLGNSVIAEPRQKYLLNQN